MQEERGGTVLRAKGGHFAPRKGGQFKPRLRGHFVPRKGGQFERVFHEGAAIFKSIISEESCG
jgi:hypothetical protein